MQSEQFFRARNLSRKIPVAALDVVKLILKYIDNEQTGGVEARN